MKIKNIIKIILKKLFIFFYLIMRFCIGIGGLIAFYSVFNISVSLDIILNVGVLLFTFYPLINWNKVFKIE